MLGLLKFGKNMLAQLTKAYTVINKRSEMCFAGVFSEIT